MADMSTYQERKIKGERTWGDFAIRSIGFILIGALFRVGWKIASALTELLP